MGNTSNFGFSYPDDTTPNDLHGFFLTLATQLETEMSRQGTLESRPAAGVKGRFYFATTWKDTLNSGAVTPWNVLYRDDGTQWRQVTPSDWQTWVPTVHVTDGNGAVSTAVTATLTGTVYKYKVLPGSLVAVLIE